MTVTPLQQNLKPVSDLMLIEPKSFELADRTLASPLSALRLFDGEWVNFDNAGKLVRACDIATLGTAGAGGRATKAAFLYFEQSGVTDVQALGKAAIVWRAGDWEFDTRIFDAAAVVASGAAITGSLQPLKVATIAGAARNYVGLVGHGGVGVDSAPIACYAVSGVPGADGFLRIKKTL